MIACNLHRTRELRCLFLELSEKLVDQWRQNNWLTEQVKLFLPALTQSVLDLEVSRYLVSGIKFRIIFINKLNYLRDQDIRCLWDRYMQVITTCLIKMYHN